MTAHKKVNELDKELVSQIEKHVKEYEISHNTKITKMAVVINQYQTYKTFYENVPYNGATIVHSAVRSDWSSIGCYNYYQTGKKLKTYYPTNEEKIDFLNLQKEYQCMNDTLYVTAYMY